jgi:excisionase family DNA binding protein
VAFRDKGTLSAAPRNLAVACEAKVVSPEPELIGTTEAASILGVSQNRIRQLIAKGQLPAVRIGRTFVIRQNDLARFAAEPPGRPRHPRRVFGEQ